MVAACGVRRLWRAATAVLALASACALAKPYDVTFKEASLGLRLEADLSVASVAPGGAAAKSGWVEVGDVLVGVNHQPLPRGSLDDAIRVIQRASLPKVLTFEPPHAGEDRAASVAARSQRIPTDGLAVVEVAVAGVPADVAERVEALPRPARSTWLGRAPVLVYHWPAAAAEFGPTGDCVVRPVVAVQPAAACTSFDNDAAVNGALAVVRRGLCSFSDKAINVQTSGGGALLVLNNAGDAVRMPLADYERTPVLLPSVMVSEAHAADLVAALEYAAGLSGASVVGRVVPAAGCRPDADDDFFPPRPPPAAADDGSADSGAAVDWSLPPDVEAYAAGADAAGALAFGVPPPDADVEVGADGKLRAVDAPASDVSVAMEFVAAGFGKPLGQVLPQGGRGARVVMASPRDACHPLANADADLVGSVVVVERGTCTFVHKYLIVAQSGAAAVVVINNEPGMFAMPALDAVVGDWPCSAAMVTKSAGAALKVALADHPGLALRRYSPRPVLRRDWEQLVQLLHHEAWPADARDRRKLYFKLSRLAHPDRARGHPDRFALLNYAYRRANHRYDPDVEFIDDLE